MKSYNEYISLLKKKGREPDYDELFNKIISKTRHSNIYKTVILKTVPVALAVIMIGWIAYGGMLFPSLEKIGYVEYVFSNGDSSKEPVLSYVFAD
jgi:hypothetical protein